jgi:hypothetical protein
VSAGGGTHAVTLHQLLGRIVYFHVLFIEPSLRPPPPRPGEACCNHHRPSGSRRTVDALLYDTAWQALDEVAAAAGYLRRCPTQGGDCCATCRVAAAADTVATSWAQTEHHVYHHTAPKGELLRACGLIAAVRLGRVFATQHHEPCPGLKRLEALRPDNAEPVSAEELPLTGELLALWADPTATTHHPVTSWLNHCSGLDEVGRLLHARRTGT